MTTADLGRGPGEDLVAIVKKELAHLPSTDLEFPVSSMSQQLANALKNLPALTNNHSPALDVGTGCGIHSFLLHQMGFHPVLAIDSNERAVRLACARGVRLGIDCTFTDRPKVQEALTENGTSGPRVLFSAIPLQDLAAFVKTEFRLMVFNPPAFFFVRNADLSSPAASGVYAGDTRSALDVDQSLLHLFFQKVVLPLLAPGGEVICTWPGLERRTVELNPVAERRGTPMHPADLLASWFALTLDCEDNDVDRFYRHTALVLDYGLGRSFWSNLDHALQNPRCYSALAKPSDWKHGSRPTFRFGVLHLRRSAADADRFEVVCSEGGTN
jgi:methylase of polypeptide subunit release factors